MCVVPKNENSSPGRNNILSSIYGEARDCYSKYETFKFPLECSFFHSSKARIRLKIEIKIELEFNQSEERKLV